MESIKSLDFAFSFQKARPLPVDCLIPLATKNETNKKL